MAPLEAQVERRQGEERHEQHDPEVVRVAGERVRPVDARAVDGAVDVDRARAPGERAEHGAVEVVAGARREQLEDAVAGVHGQAGGEDGKCLPVEAGRAADEVRDAADEQAEVEGELHHPLHELVERLLRIEVEEADQVDEQEGGEEEEDDRRRPLHAAVARGEPVEREREHEEAGEDVLERDVAAERPVDLLPRDREGAREEEDLCPASADPAHARLRSRSASSSERASRESRSRSSSGSGVPFSRPACQRSTSSTRAERIAATSSGGATTAEPVSRRRFAAAPSGGTAARIGRSAARYSNTF